MIYDHIENVSFYKGISAKLDAAFDFLTRADLDTLPIGRHEIQSEDVFALSQEYITKALSESKWEAHRRFIDVQFLVQGKERLGFGSIRQMAVLEQYNEESDVLFLQGKGCFISFKPSFFIVLGPQDAHMPGISLGKSARVKKIVVKVRL